MDNEETAAEAFARKLHALTPEMVKERMAIVREEKRAAGLSMFSMDPKYPGQIIELTPDDRRFIVERRNGERIRIQEITGEE